MRMLTTKPTRDLVSQVVTATGCTPDEIIRAGVAMLLEAYTRTGGVTAADIMREAHTVD